MFALQSSKIYKLQFFFSKIMTQLSSIDSHFPPDILRDAEITAVKGIVNNVILTTRNSSIEWTVFIYEKEVKFKCYYYKKDKEPYFFVKSLDDVCDGGSLLLAATNLFGGLDDLSRTNTSLEHLFTKKASLRRIMVTQDCHYFKQHDGINIKLDDNENHGRQYTYMSLLSDYNGNIRLIRENMGGSSDDITEIKNAKPNLFFYSVPLLFPKDIIKQIASPVTDK